MKRILYIISVLLFAMSSCTEDIPDNSVITASDEKELTFTVNIPGARDIVRTKAWTAEEEEESELKNVLIASMYVLVFDENGFLSRHKALQGDAVGSFTVKLPKSENRRILHFVCNYTFPDNFDEANALQNEATVMTGMTVPYKTIAYWKRIELSSLTEDTQIPQTISLIRNVAQISVVNDSRAATAQTQEAGYDGPQITSFLTGMEYAVGNYYDLGTVVNFNSSSHIVDGTGILEAVGATPQSINESTDFVAAADPDNTGASLYAFERRNNNPDNSNHLFIIIRAKYHVNAADSEGVLRYYKIDIVEENQQELMDVLRNKHYVLTVNLVMNEGATTLTDAVNGLSLNNIATSVMQDYNSISDGKALLNIEYVNKTFVKGGENFAIRYSYIPDAQTGATDNKDVVMTYGNYSGDGIPLAVNESTLTIDTNKQLQGYNGTEPIYPNGYGGYYLDYVRGRLMPNPSSGIAQSWIDISKNNLSRRIILRLRSPFEFINARFAEGAGATPVASGLGHEVDILFSVPDDIAPLLPATVYIYAPMIVPDATAGNIFHDEQEAGVMRHRYTVTRTGEHRLNFTTGSPYGSGEIIMRSELFTDSHLYLFRVSDPSIQNLSLSPNADALYPEVGIPITMQFTIPPESVDAEFYIYTSDLELRTVPGAGDVSSGSVAPHESGQYFVYTPPAVGGRTVTVNFKTKTYTTVEQVRVFGEHTTAAVFDRSTLIYDFNPVFVPSGPGSGTELDISFNMYNNSGNSYAQSVYIVLKDYRPRGASIGELIEVYPEEIGFEELQGYTIYRYTREMSASDTSISKTVYFETTEGISREGMVYIISSTGQYNTVEHNYQ